MIENVNLKRFLIYQENRFLKVVVVFVHAIIVVWTPLPLKVCVIFQLVTTHKPRFYIIDNPKLISMELAKV